MSSRIPVISFPENLSEEVSLSARQKHKTILYLLKLLHGSGYALASIYAIAILIIKPLLQLSYDRRLEFSQFVFKKLGLLYKSLTKQTNLIPSVSINYKGIIYKDSITSTDDQDDDDQVIEISPKTGLRNTTKVKGVRFLDEANQSADLKTEYKKLALNSSDRILVNLMNLKSTLIKLDVPGCKTSDNFQGSFISRFNGSSLSEMHPLLFQVKQFKNYLEMTTSDHPREYLFKRNVSYRSVGYTNKDHTKKTYKSLNMVDDISALLDDIKAIAKQKRIQGI